VSKVASEVYGQLFAGQLPRHEGNWGAGVLAEIDGRIIGVMVTGDDWIEDLWVAEEWRNRGVGSRLLAAGERQIAARGHALGHLRVIAENRGARRFYVRHGWSEVESYPHERWGFAMIDLSKPLAPAEPEE
jgi:GNAT superfamily N-acetyltransferase